MSGEFYALGNIAIDDLVYADGSTRWRVAGGGAMYAALGAALWTARCGAIGPIGPDYPLAECGPGADVGECRPIASTMRNWGLYEDDGSRHFVPRQAAEDWRAFSPMPADLTRGPYRFCHLAPMPWAHLAPLVATLRARGARTISLDAHDEELRTVAPPALQALLSSIDVFLPSRQDVARLVPGAAPVEALRALRAGSPDIAVIGVKCGADGAIVHAAHSRVYHAVPSAAGAPVDPTGAGDAFCGGFLAGYARTGDAREAALYGTVSAAYALEAVGPAALVRADETHAHQRLAALRLRTASYPFEP